MKKIIALSVLIVPLALSGKNSFVSLAYTESGSVKEYSFLTSSPVIKGSVPELYARGKSLIKERNYTGALPYLKGIIRQGKDPRYRAGACYLLGICFREMKKYDWSLKSLTNAEAFLSLNRGKLMSEEDDILGNFHTTLARIYREISLTYLRWNKYASAITYLWQSRRVGGDPYGPGAYEPGSLKILAPVKDTAQKKLLDYPLYRFMAAPVKAPTLKSVRKRYFRTIGEGDRKFRDFKAEAGINEPLFMRPLPAEPVKNPSSKGGLYTVHYNQSGKIVLIVHNSKEAEDFNISLSYQKGKPVSSLLESHTYHYKYARFHYEKGKLKFLMIITMETHTAHYGFMPLVRLYVF